ncbi:MAG TPA: KamA family radical SAM protein [Planctomycetota bacterium]|nr:KamA family radical SAM protein [Planctomycetota bacterium]
MGLEETTKTALDDPPSRSGTVELDIAPRQGAPSWSAPRLAAPPRPCAPAVPHNASAYPRPELAPVTWRERLFPDVADEQWNDWKWQFRNRITTLAELERFFPLAATDRDAVKDVLHEFRMGITPYYLALINPDDPADPLYKQAVPTVEEFLNLHVGEEDPLAEDQFSPVPGITHRYPDRCLMLPTNSCALYCRYCTRKRIMEEGEAPLPKSALDPMIDYIKRTPTIRDVIISGGDPLTFSTARIEELLQRLREIPHLEIIRFGSRVPVTLPQRITPELCAVLEKYGPIWINVHFNHPREVTAEAALACDRLIKCGISVNNQAVLLRGVNDDAVIVKSLVHALMRIKVRPYYLYHCDPVKGAHHFRTTVAKGIEIIENLRGHTSGLAIPTYVIDAPGGGGKIPVNPQYLLAYEQGRAILRNFQGRIFVYDDPVYEDNRPAAPKPKFFVPDQINGDINVQHTLVNGSALKNLDPKLVGHVGSTGVGKPIFQNVMPTGKSGGLNFTKLTVLPPNGNGKHNGSNGCGH